MIEQEKPPVLKLTHGELFRQELSKGWKPNEAECEDAQQMYIVSKYFPTNYLLTLKKEILTLLGYRNLRHHLNQVIKVNITHNGTSWSTCTSWCDALRNTSVLEVILPKMQQKKKRWGKSKQIQIKRHSAKSLTLMFPKCQCPERQKHVIEMSQTKKTKRSDTRNYVQCLILDQSLDREIKCFMKITG